MTAEEAEIRYEHGGVLGVPFGLSKGLTGEDLAALYEPAAKAVDIISGPQSNRLLEDKGVKMTRWKHLPAELVKEGLDEEIEAAAKKFTSELDDIVSVGIGGSFLGAFSVIQALTHSHHNIRSKEERAEEGPRIHFLGEMLDPDLIAEKLSVLDPDRTGFVVVSKSGGTVETAIMFRLLQQFLGKERLKERVIAVTDQHEGPLRAAVNELGLNKPYVKGKLAKHFNCPEGIGGRFSVMTPASLFMIAASGVNCRRLLKGANLAEKWCCCGEPEENHSLRRAVVRTAFMQRGGAVERLASNSWHLGAVLSWARQLYPESDGKRGLGLTVTEALYSREAHSDGQLVADGPRNIKELFYLLEDFEHGATSIGGNFSKAGDGLEETARSFTVGQVNRKVCEALMYDHLRSGVPVDVWKIPHKSPCVIGQLLQSELNAVLIECLILHINGVTQPGVDGYKNAMFSLLGRQGSNRELAGKVVSYLEERGIGPGK